MPGYREYDGGGVAEQGAEHGFGLAEVVDGCLANMERRRGHEDHGAVDRPANEHREEGVEELEAQLFVDDFFLFKVPLAALDDLGMEEEVVRHHDRSEHAHDDRYRAGRELRQDPADDCGMPIEVDQAEFEDEGDADDADEPDNDAFEAAIGVRVEHPEDQRQD
jgi:hypothetical protein